MTGLSKNSIFVELDSFTLYGNNLLNLTKFSISMLLVLSFSLSVAFERPSIRFSTIVSVKQFHWFKLQQKNFVMSQQPTLSFAEQMKLKRQAVQNTPPVVQTQVQHPPVQLPQQPQVFSPPPQSFGQQKYIP